MLRTNELTKSKYSRNHDIGEGLSVSRSGSIWISGNSMVGDKSKYRWFKLHKTYHFKRDYLESGDNVNLVQVAIALDYYEDGGILNVGMKNVKFLTFETTRLASWPSCRGLVVWRDVKHWTSAWRGGANNTQGQYGETEVIILMTNLRGEITRWNSQWMYAFENWGRESSTWGGVFH